MLQHSLDDWKKNMTQYDEQKKKLPWDRPQPVSYVTEREKKAIDVQYDPILQKYKDKTREALTKEIEHNDFIHTLAKNKVLSGITFRTELYVTSKLTT